MNPQAHPVLSGLCLAIATIFVVHVEAQTSEAILEVQCEGTLGTTRAGMTIEVNQETITGGHYFVAKDLRDIPITGAVHDGQIVISAADGSQFDFRFKSNGSEHGEG
jgi:hypothetical protein